MTQPKTINLTDVLDLTVEERLERIAEIEFMIRCLENEMEEHVAMLPAQEP